MICGNCGAELLPNAKYCDNCGTAVLVPTKRLVRDTQNKMIAGVCSGIANYVGVDASLVRILWILFTFAGGAGILAYIISAIIIPPSDKI